MRLLSKTELSDLQFDADLMGYRLVYLPKPLDQFHFVLYRKEPVLQHIGHYRNVTEVTRAMQENYSNTY